MKKTKNDLERDWFNKLIEEQQQAIIRTSEQLDRGKGIPHEKALKLLEL